MHNPRRQAGNDKAVKVLRGKFPNLYSLYQDEEFIKQVEKVRQAIPQNDTGLYFARNLKPIIEAKCKILVTGFDQLDKKEQVRLTDALKKAVFLFTDNSSFNKKNTMQMAQMQKIEDGLKEAFPHLKSLEVKEPPKTRATPSPKENTAPPASPRQGWVSQRSSRTPNSQHGVQVSRTRVAQHRQSQQKGAESEGQSTKAEREGIDVLRSKPN